jgi:hypothetical protein
MSNPIILSCAKVHKKNQPPNKKVVCLKFLPLPATGTEATAIPNRKAKIKFRRLIFKEPFSMCQALETVRIKEKFRVFAV